MRDRRIYLADKRDDLMFSGCDEPVQDFSSQLWQLPSAMGLVTSIQHIPLEAPAIAILTMFTE